jgi:hypothetical protein
MPRPLPDFYAERYCEENVFRLLASPLVDGADALHAVVVSSPRRAMAVWKQRTAEPPNEPVLWDYHVIALGRRGGSFWIWDLDSQLPFPCPAERYLRDTFPFHRRIRLAFRPRFRVVPAAEYHERFASDRSHMRTADGGYSAPPPASPPIGTGTNLWRFVDMEDPIAGEVLELDDLLARVSDHLAS